MIEWDEAKRASNLAKHGLDFLIADQIFDGRPAIETPSRYEGETRIVTVAEIDGAVVTAVWTWRGERRRIISLRRARRAERETYRRLFS